VPESALSLLLNDMLQCQYFLISLKTIIYNNSVCLCLQTPTVYRKLNII